jgi:hypothetical protein
VLSFTFLLPVIGWFIVMPWTLVSGLGAAVCAMFQKQRAPEPETQIVSEAPVDTAQGSARTGELHEPATG